MTMSSAMCFAIRRSCISQGTIGSNASQRPSSRVLSSSLKRMIPNNQTVGSFYRNHSWTSCISKTNKSTITSTTTSSTTTITTKNNGPCRRRFVSTSESSTSTSSSATTATATTTTQQQQQQAAAAAAAAAEEENIRKTHETLQAYAEARILKKQGKLPPKRDYYNRSKTQSQMRLQRNIAIGMVLALLTSPFIGKKVATDDDFRRQYVPTWLLPLPLRERDAAFYNNNNHNPNHTNTNNGGDDDSTTTTRSSTSEITREELHERMAQLQHDLHVRALRGDFAPEKLQTLREKRARSRLSKADMDLAEKYNWGRLHPEEDDDDDNDA